MWNEDGVCTGRERGKFILVRKGRQGKGLRGEAGNRKRTGSGGARACRAVDEEKWRKGRGVGKRAEQQKSEAVTVM